MNVDIEKKFIEVFKDNQRIIHKICRIYTNNTEDHDDLFQEITLQVWKSFPGFKGESKFSTWMYRVALNTAITITKNPNKMDGDKMEINDSLLKITEEYHTDNERKFKKMYDCIYCLSDIEKALILMYLDDKPYKEIADILGITEGNARVKMNRAKNNLKSIIKKK